LLITGVTEPIADEFTQDYIERNRIVDPHTQDDIERAIAAFNRQRPRKALAPPEKDFTLEYVSHCFHEKYELPENLRETFDEVVKSYLTKNPKPYTMKLETAVDRALFKIHEFISEENGGQIPEKAKRADDEFQESSQPSAPAPAPAPSPIPRPPPHLRNPNNLFGQLRTFGRSLGIQDHVVVKWLIEYTSRPEICEIAETPRHQNFVEGCDAMVREISPGARMFRDVCDHGLSPETVGTETFKNIMEMRHPPQNGHIWAVPKCPGLRKLQGTLFFKNPKIPECDWCTNVCCFVAGLCIHPDGTTASFTQEPREGANPGNSPKHMEGHFAITWTTTINKIKVVYHPDHDYFEEEMEAARGTGNAVYSTAFGRSEFTSVDRLQVCIETDHREMFEKLALSNKVIIPMDKEELPNDNKFLRSDPTYKRLADEAMAQIGGIPVSLCSTFGHEEAERAEDSDHGGEEAKPDWGAAAGH
jgi:hypothetical protein